MAVFNPAVPNTNDPNWLGWSKAISQPGADTSTGELLTSVAGVTGDAIKLAGYAMDEGVKNIAYDSTRKLQDEYTSSLEKADIAIRVADAANGYPAGQGTPTDVSSQSKRRSVIDAPPAEVTQEEIKRLPQDLSVLQSARANGKISNTAYEGRLVALAKDLRARYPGQRDLIDEEISKVSQRDVANKYINSILGDINSFANSGKEEDKQVRTEILNIMKLGVPGADKLWTMYVTGQLGPPSVAMPKIMSVAGPAHQIDLQLKISEKRRAERKGLDADTARDVEDEANTFLKGSSTNFFNAFHLMAGAPSADEIATIIQRANAGEIKLSDEQAQTLRATIQQQAIAASKAADDFFNQRGPDGRSRLSILGAPKVEELKKWHMNRFTEVADLIGNKEYGRAYTSMNMIRAQGDSDKARLLTDPEMGQMFRLSKALDTLGLDDNTKKFFQGMLQSKTVEQYKPWLTSAALKMVTQPDSATGVVNTLKQQAADLQKRTENANTPAIAKTQDALISSIEEIANPSNKDLKAKRNLAKAAFDPSNLGLLTMYKEDAYEWTSGGQRKFVPGKFSIFNRLYSEDMTKAMRQVGGQEWEQYKDLAKQMGFRELMGPTLRDLTRMSQDFPGVKIGWDSKAGLFKYEDDFGGPNQQFPATPTERLIIKQKIDRLNGMLSKVNLIAKEEGIDPSTMTLGWMKEFGVDVGKLPGLPAKMMQEIIRTKELEGTARPSTFKEESYTGRPARAKPPGAFDGRYPTAPGIRDQRLPYNEESAPSSGVVGSSLAEFLASPATALAKRPQNAPAASKTPKRGNSLNLGDSAEVVSVEEVPEGMSPAELIQEQNRRVRGR